MPTRRHAGWIVRISDGFNEYRGAFPEGRSDTSIDRVFGMVADHLSTRVPDLDEVRPWSELAAEIVEAARKAPTEEPDLPLVLLTGEKPSKAKHYLRHLVRHIAFTCPRNVQPGKALADAGYNTRACADALCRWAGVDPETGKDIPK